MKTLLKIAVVAALVGSQASAWYLNKATVNYVGQKDSQAVIQLKSPGGSYYTVTVPEDRKKEMLSIALTAITSGAKVTVDIGTNSEARKIYIFSLNP